MNAKDSIAGCGCCAPEADCCSAIPAEFARLRYYYGQRLGVVDLSDEQAYHAGKMRMHNRLLHGAGVVCGLRVDRFVFPQSAPPNTPTTVLRVHRGAAIDDCGREILVGADQCIDVNAWFQVHRAKPAMRDWELPGRFRLCVGLRFRECPSDPAPAPRDPCGCDGGGCEFGRVREGFQLELLAEADHALCYVERTPNLAGLEKAIAGLAGPGELLAPSPEVVLRAIHRVVAAPCADPPHDAWLCLACLQIDIDENGVVTDVVEVDNESDRRSLLPTFILQEGLLNQLGQGYGGGVRSGGPWISKTEFTGLGLNAGEMVLSVSLGSHGPSQTSTPLAEGSFHLDHVQVREFDATATPAWTPVPGTKAKYDGTSDPPVIRVDLGSSLKVDGRYRLVVVSPVEEPVVDERMRPLGPRPFVLEFRLVDDNGTLRAINAVF